MFFCCRQQHGNGATETTHLLRQMIGCLCVTHCTLGFDDTSDTYCKRFVTQAYLLLLTCQLNV